jgi:hypothetical protein
LLLELQGERRLLQLAGDGLGVVFEADVLHVLLGDGGPALGDPADGGVGPQRSQDGPDVDATVAVVALVLDGDHGVAQVAGISLQGDVLAVLLGMERVAAACRRRRRSSSSATASTDGGQRRRASGSCSRRR